MLFVAGWTFVGPANHKDTVIGKYWINPRSKMRYTKQVAVDIEELRESGGGAQTLHLERLAKARTGKKGVWPALGTGGRAKGPRINGEKL